MTVFNVYHLVLTLHILSATIYLRW